MKASVTSLISAILFFWISSANAEVIRSEDCGWTSNKIPCLIIGKPIPNASLISAENINKFTITKENIELSGSRDIVDVLKMVPGLDIVQSGPRGQQASVFTRGTNSNHTLFLLNGIPINDQSTTQGLFDAGVNFIQNIYQVDVYKGANGAHFGPDAIGGAVNFITAIDFENKLSINAFDDKNNSLNGNYTKVFDNGWNFNLRGGINNSETDSAYDQGSEKDGVKNISGSINAEKWLKDNLKLRTTTFLRQTESNYDNSSTDELGYVADDKMIATQFGLDYLTKKTKNFITFHYHNYDRDYENDGYLDEYESNSFTLRGESEIKYNEKLSYGFGGEYKHDWGEFENRGSYSASTKGYVDNTAVFANLGYKVLEDTTVSFYGRTGKHKTTDQNSSYKTNITQNINNFKFGLTHSTGLKNPSLYELYGTDNSGYSGNLNLKPEKSKTNEIFAEYNFPSNYSVSLTGFKSSISDYVEYKNSTYQNSTNQNDLKQSGIETKLNFKGKDQIFSVFGTSLSSKKENGADTLRRPEKRYGAMWNKKIANNLFFNLNYEYFGEHWDTHSTDWSTILVPSIGVADISITKKLLGFDLMFDVNNVFDEEYDRPHGYNAEGREFTWGVKQTF